MNEKSKEIKLRGGEILARAFKEKGSEHVFTLAGGFCNPALEGFMKCQIPVINCPHEQVAGHLADGHTRITRNRLCAWLVRKVSQMRCRPCWRLAANERQ